MKIRCKRKWLFFALFCGVLFYTSASSAQINVGAVDAGPFTPGSTIGVPFNAGSNCAIPGNKFELYLSDQNGSFGSETLIGSYTGFYSTYVNGIIPKGTPAGTGYKVRVKATSPAAVSTESGPFEVRAGTSVEAKLTSNYLTASNTETFGTCISKADNITYLTNESTSSSTVTASITDEVNGGAPTLLPFPTAIQNFTAQLAHYTIIAKAVMPNGTIGTKAYLLINNRSITAFGTTGNNIVCLPMGFLTFNVDITSSAGIQNNFPGDIYTITWGDQSTSVYTLCDIRANGGKVQHAYTKSSCGNVSTTSAGTIYNAFDVTINVSNAFCGNVGTPVSSSAKVVVKPVNSISSGTSGCTNTDITFTNTSVLGEDPNTNTPACTPNMVTYNWFIDGVIREVNKPRSFSLVTKFITNGEHTIRLESSSSGSCNADPIEFKICIQDPPKPAFTLPTTLICAGSTLKPTDSSVLDNICNLANSYVWTVTPTVTFANGTNAASKEPEFNFTTSGTYTITLGINTPSCGLVTTAPQTVVVNTTPIATLSPDVILCNLATYDFNNTTSGPTKTTIAGTAQDLAGTYTWTVTPAGSGTFSFTGGTTANTKYPSIKFDSYDTYTISVTHTNNCGTITRTQKLTFSTAPVVNAGADQNICFNDISFPLKGTISGTTTSQSWVGGLGNFSPNRNDLNAVYTPTAAEKASGIVTLQLKATTSLSAPCNEISDDIILRIKENINLTSAASKTICTGKMVAYKPISAVVGVTYNWTATGTASATGYSASGSGDINDVITNTDANADASVTYVITPQKDGCLGTPFSLFVVINPNPSATAIAPSLSICNKSSSAITLSSNTSGANYTYTSVVTGSITGNSNRITAGPGTVINDVLTNTGVVPGTVTYTIVPLSSGNCTGVPTTITITVLPSATLANAGLDESICNSATYTLKGNIPAVGNGKWTIVSAPTSISFADDTKNNTILSGLQPGNVYVLRWTISDAGCSTTSDDVQITVSPISVGGTSSGDATVCSGSNGGSISLTGQVGNIVRWERSVDNGLTWSTVVSTTNPFVFTGLTTTTLYRAVLQSGVCAEATSTVTTITVNPGTVAANAGIDQNLCSGNGVTLSGNNPSPNTGLWALISGQAGITITDATLFNTSVIGLIPGQTYKFRWTISGFGSCPPSSSETTITYFSPVTNYISASAIPICSGQSITIMGDVPTGGTGSFTFQWQSSADGSTWSNVSPAINKDLTLAVNSSTYYRRLVNSTICTSISNAVQVNVLPGLTNNTISADQQICLGGAAAPLTGSTPAGGSGIYIYQWQSSLNGTTWVDVLGANAVSYAPPIPTVTIYYRRSIASGPCSNIFSNQIKLTVNPPAKAEFTFTQDKVCAPFQLTASNIAAVLYPNRNASYTWFANNIQIGTGATFPGYNLPTENQAVVIKLVTTSSLGCSSDEMSHTFSTPPIVTPSFTQNTTGGCGPVAVTFTNTSSSLTEATFKWNFGDIASSNQAQPPIITFPADPTGKDITYTITLETLTPCGDPIIKTSTVLVKAKAVSIFSPDKTVGCAPFTVNFSNTSPESAGTVYTYDFGDGSPPLVKTDRSSVNHIFNTLTIKDFKVVMTAVNQCGTSTSDYTIKVSPNNIVPELVINGNEKTGCAPFTVNFVNNTSGASLFIYTFTNETTGEISTATSNTIGVYPYTFTKAGKYTIRLDANNDCSTNFTTETVTIYEQPTVSFTSDKISGCDGLIVKFKNLSKSAIGYVWDFGDGTTSQEFEPTHTFTGAGNNYSVTLKTTSALGCTNTATLTNYIKVVAPPVAAFSVTPGNEISIPNYTFGFRDTSIGSASWEWTFGDGAVSSLQNPNHTYAEDGTYTVTLKTFNKEGCSSSTFQTVRIVGVPGFLNLPNSFMPASAKNELRTFMAKGRGIQEWHMTIFNKWGQLLWETTKLDDGAPLEGWDGTYKGEEQQQGVYYWKIDIRFINGSDWKGMTYDSSPPKKTGVIYLIR
ncbi:PKD domain-containing protein [Pedobacter frigidisoli]|uniref:PKD domain-containing protein n=1 Tax=Pedobacter frigidisoli TaxID=2530455 RepID=A0A4R0P833_9SPHI|nr:PKD domain-containing protein [Pedobacter frigidisoli]TCD11688.1 PKD domain-containing protein [Pedobacter frigidisoli]